MLGRVPRLRALDLYGATDLEAIVPALPPVTELHLSGITDETLAALGRSRAAPGVEKLRLSIGALERGLGFRAFPRLSSLDLLGTRFDNAELGARDLAAELPGVRRLRFASFAPERALCVIARALGPQLEELDLSGTSIQGADAFDELQAEVAGEVLASGGHLVFSVV